MSKNIKISLLVGGIIAIILLLYVFLSFGQKYWLLQFLKSFLYLLFFIFAVILCNYISRNARFRFAIYSTVLLSFLYLYFIFSAFTQIGPLPRVGMAGPLILWFSPLVIVGWLLLNLLVAFILKNKIETKNEDRFLPKEININDKNNL